MQKAVEKGITDPTVELAGDDRGINRFRFGAVQNDEVGSFIAGVAAGQAQYGQADDGPRSEEKVTEKRFCR